MVNRSPESWSLLLIVNTRRFYSNPVVNKCFSCGNWSSCAAQLWHLFACTCENGDVGYCGKLTGVRMSGLCAWKEKGEDRSAHKMTSQVHCAAGPVSAKNICILLFCVLIVVHWGLNVFKFIFSCLLITKIKQSKKVFTILKKSSNNIYKSS